MAKGILISVLSLSVLTNLYLLFLWKSGGSASEVSTKPVREGFSIAQTLPESQAELEKQEQQTNQEEDSVQEALNSDLPVGFVRISKEILASSDIVVDTLFRLDERFAQLYGITADEQERLGNCLDSLFAEIRKYEKERARLVQLGNGEEVLRIDPLETAILDPFRGKIVDIMGDTVGDSIFEMLLATQAVGELLDTRDISIIDLADGRYVEIARFREGGENLGSNFLPLPREDAMYRFNHLFDLESK